ncbi:MAG: protein kinase [Verrucomicrobiaceae bacterium]|nr:protein kinase [Verrucomicrobiaceae bacterium]
MASELPRSCPVCHSGIPTGFPEGLCPKCLLGAQAAPKSPVPLDADLDKTVPVAAPSPSQGGRPPGIPSVEMLRRMFPDLEILEVLGVGGMGAVYKARQPRLNRYVALKIMVAAPGHEVAFALRFEREAQVLAQLSHPHIVILYDFGELGPERTGADPLYYFLMEYVDGTDLGRLIKSNELRSTQALAIVPQICEALQYAHDQGITHRDIKPANILLDKKGTVKIADFGLAKMVGSGAADAMMTGLTQTGTAMGTPHYMAPEQWEHPDQVDHRADIYALGVVFYEMLTGERPAGVFELPSKKSTPPVDKKLDSVVMRAMEKDPGRRYQHAGQIGDEVSRISGANSGKHKPRDGETETAPRNLKPVLVLGAAASLALGGWALWPEEEKLSTKSSPSASAATSSVRPGRLRAAGVTWRGQPHNLTKFAPYTDFVDVTGGGDSWVALRENGETVSLDGGSDRKGIKRIVRAVSISDDFAFIDHAGQLLFRAGREHELPPGLKKMVVVDAILGSEHGVALTESGVAVPFGRRYREVVGDPAESARWGTPEWPQPPEQALQKVKAVAATTTHAATLHHDGTVSVWGWEGLVKWTADPRQKPIRQVASALDSLWMLDEADQVWTLSLPRNPSPQQPVGSLGKPRLMESHRALRIGNRCWMRATGGWCAEDSDSRWILQQNSLGPDTVFSLITGGFSEKGQASLLWIEPVNKATTAVAAATPFTDREAAEWGLKYIEGINTKAGGVPFGVKVRVGNGPEKLVKNVVELPKEAFSVTAIYCEPPDEQNGDATIQGRLADADVLRFAGLKAVKELRLFGKLTGRSLAAVMRIPALEVLSISADSLVPADLDALKDARLSELGFFNLRARDAGALQVLSSLQSLRTLIFNGAADPALVAALPSIPKLERLRLMFSPALTDEAISPLATKFPALTEVNLARSRNLHGTTLESLKSLTKLGLIDLIDTKVDDAALATLSGTQIPRLKLAYTRITDASLPVLTSLPLLELDLSDTMITDAGLAKLVLIKTLRRLVLNIYRNAGFSAEGIAAFQKLRPDVEVPSIRYAPGGIKPATPKGKANPFPLPRPQRSAKGGKVSAWHYRDGPISRPNGVLAVPPGLDDVVALELGHMFGYGPAEVRPTLQHALALRADGKVIGWGRDEFGESKTPPDMRPAIAIAAGQRFSLALHEDGTVTGWGDGQSFIWNAALSWSDIVAIAAGRGHVLGLTSKGRVLATGENTERQTDVPAEVQGRVIRIVARQNTNLVLLDDGTVRVWGDVKKVDVDSANQARGVAAIFLSRERVFTTDASGRLTAHFLAGDVMSPPESILELQGVSQISTATADDPIVGVYSDATHRWHFWGTNEWALPEVQKHLEAAGNPKWLAIPSPQHMLGISTAVQIAK